MEVQYQASDGVVYTGVVEKLDGPQVSIRTADGKHQWVRASLLQRTISVGAGVEYLASDGNWYPGTVDAIDGEQISIRTEAGEHHWLPKASVRLRADAGVK